MKPTFTQNSGHAHQFSLAYNFSRFLRSPLVEQLKSQGSSKPGMGDRLSTLNDHIGRESAATHVSINTHGHD